MRNAIFKNIFNGHMGVWIISEYVFGQSIRRRIMAHSKTTGQNKNVHFFVFPLALAFLIAIFPFTILSIKGAS